VYINLCKWTETPADSILFWIFGEIGISNPKITAPIWWASFKSFSVKGPTPVLTIYILKSCPIIFSASFNNVSKDPAYDAFIIIGKYPIVSSL
jgi:hypothetical protein